MDHDQTVFFLLAFLPDGRKYPSAQALQISKAGIVGWQIFFIGLRRPTLSDEEPRSLPLSTWRVGQLSHPPHIGGTASLDHGVPWHLPVAHQCICNRAPRGAVPGNCICEFSATTVNRPTPS